MRSGAIFPSMEIGTDPTVIRDYAQSIEALGYDHLLAFDHVVLGATPAAPPGGRTYSNRQVMHEPLVLFGFLAGLTQRLEFATGVLILPQRPTVLVAKQASEVAVLSGGRLRLGVGLGWYAPGYDALGQDFQQRGAHCEEQIALLRRLFAEETVTFTGRWDHITAAGINPRPPGGTLPIWLGGGAPAVIERVARLADGWFPVLPLAACGPAVAQLQRVAEKAGRDPATIGIEARLYAREGAAATQAATARAWRALGTTHIGISTMDMGHRDLAGHLATLAEFKRMLDDL